MHIYYIANCFVYIPDNVLSTGAVVGLEKAIFFVSEDVGVVELCVRVFEPDIECPIEFPFSVILSTADGTAGIYLKGAIAPLYVRIVWVGQHHLHTFRKSVFPWRPITIWT